MNFESVQSFRKTLRKIERLSQIIDSDCCSTVSNAQCHALLAIEERGETTTIELSKALLLDKSTLSRTVEGLASKGLIERGLYPEDRRHVKLMLSEKGKQTCDQINNSNNLTYLNVLQKLPVEDQRMVFQSFDRFADALLEFNKESKSGGCCSEP